MNSFKHIFSRKKEGSNQEATQGLQSDIAQTSSHIQWTRYQTKASLIKQLQSIQSDPNIVTLSFEQYIERSDAELLNVLEELLHQNDRNWHRLKFVDTVFVSNFDSWAEHKNAMLYSIGANLRRNQLPTRIRAAVTIPLRTEVDVVLSFLKKLKSEKGLKMIIISGPFRLQGSSKAWKEVAELFHPDSDSNMLELLEGENPFEVEFQLFYDASEIWKVHNTSKSWHECLEECIRTLEIAPPESASISSGSFGRGAVNAESSVARAAYEASRQVFEEEEKAMPVKTVKIKKRLSRQESSLSCESDVDTRSTTSTLDHSSVCSFYSGSVNERLSTSAAPQSCPQDEAISNTLPEEEKIDNYSASKSEQQSSFDWQSYAGQEEPSKPIERTKRPGMKRAKSEKFYRSSKLNAEWGSPERRLSDQESNGGGRSRGIKSSGAEPTELQQFALAVKGKRSVKRNSSESNIKELRKERSVKRNSSESNIKELRRSVKRNSSDSNLKPARKERGGKQEFDWQNYASSHQEEKKKRSRPAIRRTKSDCARSSASSSGKLENPKKQGEGMYDWQNHLKQEDKKAGSSSAILQWKFVWTSEEATSAATKLQNIRKKSRSSFQDLDIILSSPKKKAGDSKLKRKNPSRGLSRSKSEKLVVGKSRSKALYLEPENNPLKKIVRDTQDLSFASAHIPRGIQRNSPAAPEA